MATSQQPSGVLLVGSVPLANEEEVFRTASSILGDRIRRIPDGETGHRSNWITFQMDVMAATPLLERLRQEDTYGDAVRFRLQEGANPADLKFGELGYEKAAKESWETFKRLKDEGVIPAGTRFEVSLPTPLASIAAYIDIESQPDVEPAYEQRMREELDAICDAIPHDQLAIQWDIAVEFGALEGVFPVPFDDVEAEIVDRLVRISGYVPEDVELGLHLCYGDYGHQHFVQPEDTSKLVSIANAVSARVERTIEWLHLPVPRDRSDDAYYAPLADLKLHPETELFLGLVHYTDGVEGTRKRIQAAQKVVPQFGVATECGLGRRPPETIEDLLKIHAEVAGA